MFRKVARSTPSVPARPPPTPSTKSSQPTVQSHHKESVAEPHTDQKHIEHDSHAQSTHKPEKNSGETVRNFADTSTSVVNREQKSKSTQVREALVQNGPEYLGKALTGATGILAVGLANQRLGQLGDNLKNGIKAIPNPFQHLPNGHDINEAVKFGLEGAHNLGSAVAGPVQNGLTIVTILGCAILAYQAYKYLR